VTTRAPALRVLIVDDHALVRTGVRLLLESRGGLDVVGEAADCESAVALAERTRPDVVLLDLDLGLGPSIRCVRPLVEALPGAKLLILTGVRDGALHRKAVKAGARGVVAKEKAAETLLKAIEKVQEGELWLERSLMAELVDDLSEPGHDIVRATIAELTPREREVVALVARGLKNKDIAGRLRVSDVTVRHHLTSVFGKLGVKDRLSLVIFAFQHGLADLPPR
jgi:DNA-binding NarL/FixJ family response regulator